MNIATQTMSTATLHSLSIPDYCIIMQFMTFDWFCNQGTWSKLKLKFLFTICSFLFDEVDLPIVWSINTLYLLTFLSVLLNEVAIFGRCVFDLWSLSTFRVIVSRAQLASLPSWVDVNQIFSIYVQKKNTME